MMSKLCTQMRLEGTSFHASPGRTGMKKRASFEIFVRHIRTTVRKWELWGTCLHTCLYCTLLVHCLFIAKYYRPSQFQQSLNPIPLASSSHLGYPVSIQCLVLSFFASWRCPTPSSNPKVPHTLFLEPGLYYYLHGL